MTKIMGILNITPDSFSGDGILNYANPTEYAIKMAELFIKQGADIIDIGAESTRPGAVPISSEEELKRLLPILQTIKNNFSIPISVDTMHATVAEAALAVGVEIINDVSGLQDENMAGLLAKNPQAKIILMHSIKNRSVEKSDFLGTRYVTSNNQENLEIVFQIRQELLAILQNALSAGIEKNNIILDPGIGFGKTVAENFAIIRNLEVIVDLGFPVLVGVSRKSFIGYTVKAAANDRLGGSIAANLLAYQKGASIFRVHDVFATAQALQVVQMVNKVI